MLPRCQKNTDDRADIKIDPNTRFSGLSDSLTSLNFCSIQGKLNYLLIPAESKKKSIGE